MVSPEAGRDNCLPYVLAPPSLQVPEDEGIASPVFITMTQSLGSFENEYEKFLDEKERARKRQRFEGEKTENFPCKISKFRHAFYTVVTKVKTFNRSSKLTVDKAIPLYPKIVQEICNCCCGFTSVAS